MTSRRRFSATKVVRSRTVELLEKRGAIIKTRPLEMPEYILHLEKKLIEEANEVVEVVTAEKRISELADALEVISALAATTGSSLEEIERVRQEKFIARGGCDQRIYCEYVEVSADNELAQYYQENHYPEIPVE